MHNGEGVWFPIQVLRSLVRYGCEQSGLRYTADISVDCPVRCVSLWTVWKPGIVLFLWSWSIEHDFVAIEQYFDCCVYLTFLRKLFKAAARNMTGIMNIIWVIDLILVYLSGK